MKLKPYTVIALDETSGTAIGEFVHAPSPQEAAMAYAQMCRDADRVIVAVLAGEQQVLYPESGLGEYVCDLAKLGEDGGDE